MMRCLVILLIALGLTFTGCGKPDLPGVFVFSSKAEKAGTPGVYTQPASGKKAHLLLSDPDARSPRLSADGRTMFYTTIDISGTEVFAYDLASRDSRVVTSHQTDLSIKLEKVKQGVEAWNAKPANPFSMSSIKTAPLRYDVAFPKPSSDGRYLTYITVPRNPDMVPLFRGELFFVPAEGGPHRLIGDGRCATDWAPGTYTAYGCDRRRTFRYQFSADPMGDAGENLESTITKDKSMQGDLMNPAVSHDGLRMAWVQGQAVDVGYVDGSNTIRIASQNNFKAPFPGVVPTFVAWSPDDVYVAVCCGLKRGFVDGTIFVFRSDGEPIYKSSKYIEIEGLVPRVDAFDWVASSVLGKM